MNEKGAHKEGLDQAFLKKTRFSAACMTYNNSEISGSETPGYFTVVENLPFEKLPSKADVMT